MCYDAPNFAVAVVDFRMSTARGMKVMDATLRFVNKTNQALILGYVDGSGIALDDQGNRYGTYNNQGLAGIGLVSGANGDPKFVLQPGSAGDARFELYWHPGAQDPIGSTFELDMNIRQINTLVGGQHTLGSEVPLRFQGISNGMTGGGLASSTAAAGGAAGTGGTAGFASSGDANNGIAGASVTAPCDANGSQTNAAVGAANSLGGQSTANAASNAAAAISSFKSMFGKKKTAQPAANSPTAPCVPAGTVAAVQPNGAAPAIASAAPVANARTTTQNATLTTAGVPANGAKLAAVGTTGATTATAKPATAKPVTAKPAAQSAAATQKTAPQKQPAAAKKPANQTDTSH